METTQPESDSIAENHGHGHVHAHEHAHDHVHGHDHVHEHAHDHVHAHEQALNHDHAHGHEHGHGHDENPGAPHHGCRAAGIDEGKPHVATARLEASDGLILTVRANCGLSGDIMLAGLADLAGLDDEALDSLAAELELPALRGVLALEDRQVNSIAGVGCRINLPHEHAHRTMQDILQILRASKMPLAARTLAEKAFTILAEAEAAVHGMPVESVTFHEVGALDSILDICLVCRIVTMLAPVRFVCSPLPVADGTIHCAHGFAPSPAPAALRMLVDIPVQGFRGQGETVTPTALCLLRALDAEFGPWPDMLVRKSVISYGNKYFPGVPNGAVWALGEANGEHAKRPMGEGSRR